MTTIAGDQACPSCGGSGGGPFGRPGSAWDVEDYVCPRCRGLGQLADTPSTRPGIAKATAPAAPATPQKRKQSGSA